MGGGGGVLTNAALGVSPQTTQHGWSSVTPSGSWCAVSEQRVEVPPQREQVSSSDRG